MINFHNCLIFCSEREELPAPMKSGISRPHDYESFIKITCYLIINYI
jgi:hypothetical protein